MPVASTKPAPPVTDLAVAEHTELPPPVPPGCANCGAILQGPYCGQCGQHVADYHRSVWRFLQDFFDNTFCWDNKFLLTVRPLLQQPGFLTQEFMVGRRVRYVHPLRLFLFISAISLAVTGFISHHRGHSHAHAKVHRPAAMANAAQTRTQSKDEKDTGDADEDISLKADATAPAAPAATVAASPADSPASADTIGQTVQRVLAGATSPSATSSPAATPERASHSATAWPGQKPGDKSNLEDRINRVVENTVATAEAASEQAKEKAKKGEAPDWADPEKLGRMANDFTEGVEHRLSWVALALLPVFALLLRAVYWREDSYYFTHLVFSLHYHAFLLAFWIVYACAGIAADILPLSGLWNFLLACAFFLPGWYLYAALRLVYGEGSRRTMAKVLLLGSMHLLIIFIGVASVGAMSMFSGSR